MKVIEVELEGTSPILQHSALYMVEEQNKVKKSTKQYDNKVEAEKVCYRNSKKELFVPSIALKGCMINGAAWFKFGKRGAKGIIAGACRIEQRELILLDKKGKPITKYEIDLRPVNVMDKRIIRARPRIDEWTLRFNLIYNEAIVEVDTLKAIMEESGQRVGLLDNRPQKFGENGTFVIKKFKVL